MIKTTSLPLEEKIKLVISSLIILSLVVAIIIFAFNQRWFALFVSSAALLLMLAPTIFEKRSEIDLPVELEIAVVFFIYATLFLGEVNNFYFRFWWWDLFLHGISALGFGFIGFMILYVLYKNKKLRTRPVTIAIFSFSFAVAIGVLWEIFEFASDSLFGFNLQKSGLADTMGDLIVDSIGALLASVLGFVYLKTGKLRIFEHVVEEFIRKNPQLVKK